MQTWIQEVQVPEGVGQKEEKAGFLPEMMGELTLRLGGALVGSGKVA
jgi:hypothetical protein